MDLNRTDSLVRIARRRAARARAMARIVGFAVLAASAVPAARGETGDDLLRDAPVDELKRAYLLCSREAASGRLNGPEIMQCSIVYEELKRRAFDGDFEKLFAWSRTQPLVVCAPQAAGRGDPPSSQRCAAR